MRIVACLDPAKGLKMNKNRRHSIANAICNANSMEESNNDLMLLWGWETADPVEGTPPTCYSTNSIVSTDGKACSNCPFNTFGSRNGDSLAKACKESVSLFMLRPGNIMPIIVRIPVSSKVIFQRYLTRLIGKMLPLSGVVTKITLDKTTNKAGQPYSVYSFEAVDMLSPDDAAKAKLFGEGFINMLNNTEDSLNIHCTHAC